MRYVRLPVQDEYAANGRRAVFVDSNVVVLADLGDAALEFLDDGPVTQREVAAYLREIFGDPPTGDLMKLTRECLDSLRESGLVKRTR